MRGFLIFSLLMAGLSALPCSAQSFSFYSTMRAGLPANGDWEIGVGTTSSASTVTSQFAYSPPSGQHWNPSGTQNFQIGWSASTQTAYTAVQDLSGAWRTASLVYSGPALPANSIWTLPGNGFYASATGLPSASSILLESLTLSPNVSILNGSLPTGFGASQPGGGPGASSSLGTNLVIDPASNGGSWFISGTIQFQGLTSQGGEANRSRLQFHLNAISSASAVPEPASFAAIAGGLILLVLLRKSRLAVGLRI